MNKLLCDRPGVGLSSLESRRATLVRGTYQQSEKLAVDNLSTAANKMGSDRDKPTILVADDSPVYRNLVEQSLAKIAALLFSRRRGARLWICLPRFNKLYAKTGRPSIAPEKLLRALVLQARGCSSLNASSVMPRRGRKG
jgi:hypothetical protein